MMDLRAKQYFKDEESFHRAMKLFQQYLDARSRASSLDQLQEEFFDHLDDVTDFESDLLARAGNYFKSKQLDSGVDPYAEAVRQLTETLSKHTAQQTEHTGVISITLDKAFEEFLMNARGEWKSTGGMEDNYRKIYFPIFKELVGEITCDQLTKAHINEYIKLVQSLPANKTKIPQYRDMMVRDFLKSPAKAEHGLKPLTKKKYLNHMSRFFKWLRTNDYTLVDLELPFSNVKIKKARSVDQRSAYTSSDIRKLFNSKEYTKGLHKQASHFWVPLIALYTGARLNEICQLSTQDIKVDKTTSRWVFDINEDIFPKSLGGKDDLSNYQALCYSCNAAKRNTDDTDFRLFKSLYEHREEKCLFCEIQTIDRKRIIAENNLAYAIRDGFAVTEGHTLFIPKRHVVDYFGLVPAEVSAINLLMAEQKRLLQEQDSTIDGFNIGMNCGETAGQTIFHCHVHLIPRRKGDVENPRGGVRHIIAGKGFYEDKK